VLLNDISEVRREAQAEANEKMQTLYFASVAHDLKTPINSIYSANQQMSATAKPGPQQDILRMQASSCKFLLHLIEDILDLSKFKFGKFEQRKQTFELEQEVEEVVQIMSYQSQTQGIDLGYTIDQHVPKRVLLDVKRLKQVLFNLVGNAIKFTKKGFVHIYIGISSSKEATAT